MTLGKSLSNIAWDKVYSSDLQRAITTTNYILQYSTQDREVVSFESTPLLREVSFGVREALPRGTSVSQAKEIISKRDGIHVDDIIDSAESNYQVYDRQDNFFKKVIRDIKNMKATNDKLGPIPRVLVVTHGAFIRLLVNRILKSDKLEAGGLKNCSISRIMIICGSSDSDYEISLSEGEVNRDDHLTINGIQDDLSIETYQTKCDWLVSN